MEQQSIIEWIDEFCGYIEVGSSLTGFNTNNFAATTLDTDSLESICNTCTFGAAEIGKRFRVGIHPIKAYVLDTLAMSADNTTEHRMVGEGLFSTAHMIAVHRVALETHKQSDACNQILRNYPDILVKLALDLRAGYPNGSWRRSYLFPRVVAALNDLLDTTYGDPRTTLIIPLLRQWAREGLLTVVGKE